ncbi:MAG TPA: VWA domain-containing protein, partial [Candidatus Binataceae bacterium]|nr:VWA domain-containing protein [Candidatus Binataceae bacterium]
ADSQGHPVSDLTAAELQVTDQGKTQPIASFRKDTRRPSVATSPSEFSNRPAALNNVHVILFDLLNLDMAARKPATDQIVRALEHLEVSESVYLYLVNLSGELVRVRALPESMTDLRAAGAPWTTDARALLEKAIGPVAAMRPVFERDIALRVKTTYNSLEIVAGRLALLPGRKTIDWITAGVPRSFPLENGQIFDCIPNLRQAAGKIAQANVSVNPVSQLLASTGPENLQTLQEFADLTGGKLYQGGDIERAIPDTIEASRSVYRVQYAPPGGNWDGKFHKVRVTATRKGVNIQSEQGYTADKQAPAASDRTAALFQNPFDASDIGLRTILSPLPEPHKFHVQIIIDANDLQLAPQADRFAGQLTLMFGGYLADGKLQSYPPMPVNLNLTAEQRDRGARDGLKLGNDLTVDPAAGKVRLVVTDRGSNTSATLTIPIAPVAK